MKNVLFVLLLLTALPLRAADCVILLHGLLRSSASMENLEVAFSKAGYQVANIDYPSRSAPVAELAELAVTAGLEQCGEVSSIHFVTHSLGGILVRYYLSQKRLPKLGRVVMLAPPNQGSQVVDKLKHVPGFRLLNGPAGMQLGTDDKSIPALLPAVDYPVGVIAGSSTINPMLSLLLPNPDDGKVSVANTRVDGMQDFISVDYSHPFIMQRNEVITLVLRFISIGRFKPS